MLHVGLDLSRRRVDVCLISSEGELVEHFRAPAGRDGLYGLTRRVAVYDELYRLYRELHDTFGGVPGVRADLSSFMKRLLAVRDRAHAGNN